MRAWKSITTIAVGLSLLGSVVAVPSPWANIGNRAVNNTPPAQADSSGDAVGVTGSVQTRLEIRDLQKNSDQWNIYLLALARFYSMDQNDMLSYYQIAGIHGRPPIPWNGIGGVSNPTYPGYCTHSSNIFIPWHRPYLALYEQLVISHAVDAANSFSDSGQRNRYLAAASALRVPYWDWAMVPPSGQNVVPDFLGQKTISVITPNGPATIDNPLYTYKFHPAAGSDPNDPNGLYYYPWSKTPQTLRNPTGNNDPNAQSQDSKVVSTFNSNSDSIRSRIYTLLTQYDRYAAFGSSSWTGGGNNADSLESVHDNIHGFIGGGQGHMSILDFSAFDPIFWLHHTMVDRIGALWQIVHPGTYVESAAQRGGAFWYNSGEVFDSTTPLVPFVAPSGKYWTSDDVRGTEIFNYNYPGISQSTSQTSARSLVNQLYGQQGQVSSRSPLSHGWNAVKTAAGSLNGTSNGEYLDYVVVIKAPKDGWPISYYIYFFLGEPATTSIDADCLMSDPAFVGLQSVVSRYRGDTMKSGQAAHMLVGSTIPLNQKISAMSGSCNLTDTKYGLFSTNNEVVVTDYLEENLHWKIVDATGQEVSPDAISDLEIAVVAQRVSPATSSDTFPTWTGALRYWPSVTRKKQAGYRGGDPTFESSSSSNNPNRGSNNNNLNLGYTVPPPVRPRRRPVV